MDQLPNIVAGLNFTVEARCPICQNLNKYQQLSSAHSNTKNYLNKPAAERAADWSIAVKCGSCDKWFKITKTVFV